MNEAKKIQEASHFLAQMRQSVMEHEAFQHNLSAFLSASRSALQYALEEAKPKSGGQQWYDAAMLSDPVLKFLKDKRDCNIHRAPVTPHPKITITDTYDLGQVRDFLTIRVTDKDGNIVSETECNSPEPERPTTNPESTVEYSFLFDDWSGTEDCLVLADSYLTSIRSIVADGVTRSFLSGT